MADRDLKLNSLARYAKASPDLVLEEWDHCEIPAGCGGAVLRWWNPAQGSPVSIWVHSDTRLAVYLDGRPVRYTAPLVTVGPHVLAFELFHAGARPPILLVAAATRGDTVSGRTSLEKATRPVVLSADDGSWRYTQDAPAHRSWTQPSFDDSPWAVMRAAPPPEPDRERPYAVDRLTRFGAAPLRVEGTGPVTWIRKVFEMRGEHR